jgi:type I restriction enzyme M protein
LRYLSGNYEESAKKELGADYPQLGNSETNTPLALWYEQNQDDVSEFISEKSPSNAVEKDLFSM